MREAWTDERLDELSGRVGEMNLRFDALQRTMIQVAVGLIAAFGAILAGILGLIATQL